MLRDSSISFFWIKLTTRGQPQFDAKHRDGNFRRNFCWQTSYNRKFAGTVIHLWCMVFNLTNQTNLDFRHHWPTAWKKFNFQLEINTARLSLAHSNTLGKKKKMNALTCDTRCYTYNTMLTSRLLRTYYASRFISVNEYMCQCTCINRRLPKSPLTLGRGWAGASQRMLCM